VLIGGLMVFALAGLLSALTTSFSTLLAARLLQGIGAGAPRVVSARTTPAPSGCCATRRASTALRRAATT
jgi:predicted MFS family arabinose efflux permease